MQDILILLHRSIGSTGIEVMRQNMQAADSMLYEAEQEARDFDASVDARTSHMREGV